jgi:hypothetical protein
MEIDPEYLDTIGRFYYEDNVESAINTMITSAHPS